MDWLTDPQVWASLVTLTALEIVLGIDNLVFIAIVAGRLPPRQQNRARQIGLGLALITRLALLASIVWIIGLTRPVFELFGQSVSWRDIVLIAGGFLLLYKSTREIHQGLEDGAQNKEPGDGRTSFAGVVAQIMLLDVVLAGQCAHRSRHGQFAVGHGGCDYRRHRDHAHGIKAACRFRRTSPDRKDAGIEFSAADWHDADRRRRRLRGPQGVHIRRDRVLGRGGDLEPIRRAPAQVASRWSLGSAHPLELKSGIPPVFEKSLRVEVPEDFDQRRHHTSPAGLMTGADAGAVVAVKILVKQ